MRGRECCRAFPASPFYPGAMWTANYSCSPSIDLFHQIVSLVLWDFTTKKQKMCNIIAEAQLVRLSAETIKKVEEMLK